MRAAVRLVPEQIEYESVTYAEAAYVMTPASFADGCMVVTDAHTGREVGVGKSPLGSMARVPLGVPLCRGCDGAIEAHVCDRCEVVFQGEPGDAR